LFQALRNSKIFRYVCGVRLCAKAFGDWRNRVEIPDSTCGELLRLPERDAEFASQRVLCGQMAPVQPALTLRRGVVAPALRSRRGFIS
jgi:hypothetical protein